MFRVPESSSPPSTPGSRRSHHDAPSTTPAGPPPGRSMIASSTPAGPPPTDLFTSSRFQASQQSNFNFTKSALGGSPPKTEFSGFGSGYFGAPTSARPGSQRGRSGYRFPSSPPQQEDEGTDADAEGSEEEDEDMDEEDDEELEEEEEDEDMEDEDDEQDEDDERDDTFAHGRSRGNRFSHSVASQEGASELGNVPIVQAGTKQTQYDLLNLAKGLTPPANRTTTLREPDEVVLETERILEKLHDSTVSDTPEKRAIVLGEVAQELLSVWQASTQSSPRGNFSASGRGGAPALSSANELANLLLNIHHPSIISEKQRGPGLSLIPTRPESRHYTPLPKALLDWLNTFHDTAMEIPFVLRETDGYSASERFWDAVSASAIRGKFLDTLKLLKGANFAVAETAGHDGLGGEDGYTGRHLQNTNLVVRSLITVLEECPAVTFNDWDVKGHDWNMFRQRASGALEELEDFAEGDSQNSYNASQSFQASHFGISQSQNFGLSQASRKAESKVPWTIYEQLKRLYRLLLGNEEEIIAIASDWIEAVVGLTVWWNGEEDDVPPGSLAASRRSIARSQRVRTVDVTPVKAYCQRLTAALAYIVDSDEDDLSINTTDRFEIGLACIFDDNVEGILQILRGFSLPIASAVAEVASCGEWFRRADGILDQFDQSDLMVLSYNEEQRAGVSKDDLLVAYSDLLASQKNIVSQNGKTNREGWELAVQVLGRLDDDIVSNERIQDILNNLSLEQPNRVDKITQLCYSMGLSDHARTIALKYADHLRSNTQNYGDTLLYYAQAHDSKRIQEVLRVLVAHCLVKSVAYPHIAELDPSLSALITSPKQTLTDLAKNDPEGAHLLSNYLSGYATIRKFYDLRDEAVLLKANEKPAHRPMARKRAAANALTVIIQSAASCIRGGLYDPEVETVVQVDVLLPLLGEALVFVNQPKRTLALPHLYSLLAAVEDLDTAPSMIRAQCEEVLSTTLATAHGDAPKFPSPTSLLQKSTSNLTTASSQYSLIGSAEFGSAGDRSTDGSAVLVRGSGPEKEKDTAKRGWDWRKGFAKDAKGEDIVRVLRLGIAKEIGRAFVNGEV